MVSSNNLYHFTSKFEYLKSILREGLRVSYSLEDFSWLNGDRFGDFALDNISRDQQRTEEKDESLKTAIPMTCFCDIPSSLIKDHTAVYGEYAIGFDKEWGRDKGINPLLYLASESNVSGILQALSLLPDRVCEENVRNNLQSWMKIVLAHTKPYEGHFKKGDYENNKHRFYDEREWRYMSPYNCYPPLNQEAFCKRKDKLVEHIQVVLSQVKVIVVTNLAEKEVLLEEFANFSDAQIKSAEEFKEMNQ